MKKPKPPNYQLFATITAYEVAVLRFRSAMLKYMHWKGCNRIHRGLKRKEENVSIGK